MVLKNLNKRQQSESEALSERQQNESEALSERQEEERDALSERQQDARKALTERQSAEMQALTERHQTELANIESEKTARIKALNEAAAKDVKPTTLEDVNEALEELNTYADKTIYNFADMTKNIGTFTAAGVDLDTSVQAIKGIANLAALSGANSQKASNAMDQLSQAIASGTVRLTDWMSVEHSDIGGKTFQEALKETARVHGIAVDDMISKNGSFRNSLSEGWLTSDVLLETLSKFTGDLTEEQLRSMGYTEDQIDGIIKMGQTAVESATKVRTWTQALDTTKEAMGSGWAQTWELIFGNFDEATELWTGFSEFLGGIIDKQSNARNAMLGNWKAYGGRDAGIETMINLWKGLESVLTPIQKAFRDVFPKTTGKQLADMTKNLKDFTSRLKLSDTASENLKNTFSGLFSFISLIGKGFKAAFEILKPGVGVITNLAGGVLDVTGKLGAWVTQINKTVSKDTALAKGFENIKNTVASVFTVFNNFVTSIRKFIASKFKMPDVSFISNFSKSVESGTKPLQAFLNLIKTGFTEASKVLGKVAPVFKALIKPITDMFKGGMGLEDAVNILTKGVLTGAITKFVINLSGTIKSAKKAFDPIKDIGEEITETFGAIQNQLNSKALMNVAAAIAILVGSLVLLSTVDESKLASGLGAITALLAELTVVMAALDKIAQGSSIFDSAKMAKMAKAMVSIGASILILSVALKQISKINSNKIMMSLGAITVLMTEMVAVSLTLSKFGGKIKSSGLALIGFATSILILTEAVDKLAQLNTNQLVKGLASVGVLIGEVAAFMIAAKFGKFKASQVVGVVALAASMLVFQKAVSSFGNMPLKQIATGLGSMAVVLGEITIAMNAMKGTTLASVSIILVTTALLGLIPILKTFGKMSWKKITKGLTTLGIALAELAIGLNAMKGTLLASSSLLVASAALLAL